jgi:hypothetical protein
MGRPSLHRGCESTQGFLVQRIFDLFVVETPEPMSLNFWNFRVELAIQKHLTTFWLVSLGTGDANAHYASTH